MKRGDGFSQRTKDGYFDATLLIDVWNMKQKNKKQLARYKVNQSTKEFILELKKEGIDKPIITGRGKGGGTWMHPKLFIDFAMWVSTEYKSKVIDYVLDGLIFNRNEAGDYYKEMSAAILETYISFYGNKPPSTTFINEARLVRKLVTDKKDRNEMTEQELKQITYLQKVNTMLIKKNVGKSSRIKRLKEANEINI